MLTLKQRLALAWRILTLRNTQLTEHARRELVYVAKANGSLKYNGLGGAARVQNDADTDAEELVAVFASQRHTAVTGAYTAARVAKLFAGSPLLPLTGGADEWEPFGPGLWQNKRCRSVFKDDSNAWDHDAVVFRRPDGVVYATPASRLGIKFPYVRKVRYVEVGS